MPASWDTLTLALSLDREGDGIVARQALQRFSESICQWPVVDREEREAHLHPFAQ